MKNVIYALIDPRDESVRYVGKSTTGLGRAREHRTPGRLRRDTNTHKRNWILQLQSIGSSYRVELLECADDSDALGDLEREWIARMRAQGASLVNKTAGGEGALGRRMSEDTKKRMSVARTGVEFSEAHRAALAIGHGSKPFVDNLGQVHASVREAARQLGLDASAICRVLRGQRRSTNGYTFSYKWWRCSERSGRPRRARREPPGPSSFADPGSVTNIRCLLVCWTRHRCPKDKREKRPEDHQQQTRNTECQIATRAPESALKSGSICSSADSHVPAQQHQSRHLQLKS